MAEGALFIRGSDMLGRRRGYMIIGQEIKHEKKITQDKVKKGEKGYVPQTYAS